MQLSYTANVGKLLAAVHKTHYSLEIFHGTSGHLIVEANMYCTQQMIQEKIFLRFTENHKIFRLQNICCVQ